MQQPIGRHGPIWTFSGPKARTSWWGSTARLFQAMLLDPFVSLFSGNTIEVLMSSPNQDDLRRLSDLAHDEQIAPRIDRRLSLRRIPDALRYTEERRVCGKVVITV